MPTVLNTIGDHIKKRRLELGLYQRQVAELIGVDECTVTNWERKRTTPALRYMPKIIEFLGYDPSVGEHDTLGGNLLHYRESRGMTQKVLARRIGIDPTTLSRVERNQGRSLNPVMEKLVDFLRRSGVEQKPRMS